MDEQSVQSAEAFGQEGCQEGRKGSEEVNGQECFKEERRQCQKNQIEEVTMANKAKKKSAVSRAVRTVKKAATSTARSTRKVVKKMIPGKYQEEIFQALIETTVPEVEYRFHHRWHASCAVRR
jgi:predicted NodU family carbamoyl transferase